MTKIFTNLCRISESLSDHTFVIHIQTWIRCIGQRSTAAIDSHTDTTDQVAHADRDARPKQRVASVVIASRVYVVRWYGVQLRGEDNGHDNAIDGNDFAEDDRDEVLGSYPWGFDTATDD